MELLITKNTITFIRMLAMTEIDLMAEAAIRIATALDLDGIALEEMNIILLLASHYSFVETHM